jgi:hypothetical protein
MAEALQSRLTLPASEVLPLFFLPMVNGASGEEAEEQGGLREKMSSKRGKR